MRKMSLSVPLGYEFTAEEKYAAVSMLIERMRVEIGSATFPIVLAVDILKREKFIDSEVVTFAIDISKSELADGQA